MSEPEEQVLERLEKSGLTKLGSKLIYTGQESLFLPSSSLSVIGQMSACILDLDLSFCRLDLDLSPLEQMFALQTLTMDSCGLSDSHCLPYLKHTKTLSLNKNEFMDLSLLMSQLSTKMPSMTLLSLLGNAACPHPVASGFHHSDDISEASYKRYRLHVAHVLPNLMFLDSLPINDLERVESLHSGHVALTHLTRNHPAHSGFLITHCNHNSASSSSNSVHYSSNEAIYGKRRYRYSGNHSEGNRFIRDSDL